MVPTAASCDHGEELLLSLALQARFSLLKRHGIRDWTIQAKFVCRDSDFVS